MIKVVDFSPSALDPGLFIHLSPQGNTLQLLYIDDMLITRDDAEHISHVKKQLGNHF